MMMKSRSVLALGLLTTALAGCGRGDSASFVIDGGYNGSYISVGANTALTLARDKANAWSDWELAVVVRRHPACQQRHPLLSTNDDAVKVEVYAPEPGVYIFRQGKRWYVTETKTCQMQLFKEPPPVPGTLVGAFKEKDGAFSFVPFQ